MSSFLASLHFWHWWILAALLAAVEAVAPGIFFIWFGAAAAIVGLATLILPGMGWEIQVFLFAILAAVAVFVGRRLVHRRMESRDPALNRRGERYSAANSPWRPPSSTAGAASRSMTASGAPKAPSFQPAGGSRSWAPMAPSCA